MKRLRILLIIMMVITLTGCNEQTSIEDKKYSITFVENGGSDVEDMQEIEKNAQVTLPNTTREGYTFNGWYTSKKFISGTQVTDETEIGKNLTLYAKWTALVFNFNLDLNGGTLESIYKDGNNKVDYGTEIVLPMPIKAGYLFDGWFIDDEEVAGNIIISEDISITSKWIDINTLQKNYNLSLNLDGGALYLYNSKEELMEDFFADYSKFVGRSVDSTNFWDMSYRSITNHDRDGFLDNETYISKWRFFLEYLSTTAREENRDIIINFLNKDDSVWNQMDTTRAVLRNEILAFFLNTERVVPGWGSLISGNYASEELQNGYLAYCQIETPTSYVTGEGIVLQEPLKEGYVFLGWYENAEFTGKVFNSVEANEYGDKVFYALWGKV